MSGGVVLVTDGDQRAALAVTRSLGRAGYEVVVTGPGSRSLAGVSRHAAAYRRVGDAAADPSGYAAALAALARRHGARVVMPITEASLLAVLPARDSFAPAVIPFPDDGPFRAICDKGAVLARAAGVGLAVPAAIRIEGRGDRALAAGVAGFPVVVKPERSVKTSAAGLARLTVSHAADPAELTRILDGLPDEAYPLQVQQRIIGEGTGLFFLRWNGRILARFAHRRLREKPPSGGVSVYSESIAIDEDLASRAAALLDGFGWHGVAMVEFKRRSEDGIPFLMEINGRFWGSLQLAIDAGVDFPRLLVEAADGRPADAPPSYRVGQRCRWWWGDVDQLVTRLRRSRSALHLPPGMPGRLRAAVEVLVPGASPGRNEVARWSDLRPALVESVEWFRGLR